MKMFLAICSLFCALGIALADSALKPKDVDGETDVYGARLHERLSRIEAIMFADDTLSNRLGALEKEIKQVGEENKLLREVVERQASTLKQLTFQMKKLRSDHVTLKRSFKGTPAHIISTVNDENPKQDFIQKHLDKNRTTQYNGQMMKHNARRIGGKFENLLLPDQDTKNNNNLWNLDVIQQPNIRQSPVEQVAFYSTVSVPDIWNLGMHHPIVFDRVITNIGGAYHPNTGIFITPVDGVYVFNLGAMSCSRKFEYLELVKDGSWIQSVYPDARCGDICTSDSLVAVLELNQGNEVWVRTAGGSGEIHGNSYTFFSGWLLFMK